LSVYFSALAQHTASLIGRATKPASPFSFIAIAAALAACSLPLTVTAILTDALAPTIQPTAIITPPEHLPSSVIQVIFSLLSEATALKP